jgi:HlyD family secretion protein
MRKIHIAQTSLVFGLAAGLLVAVPTFLWRVSHQNPGLILVNGRIEGTEVAVGTRLLGRVISVHATEGQEVRKGDLLIELDPKDIQAGHDETLAAVSHAKHNLASAKENVFRSKEQYIKSQIGLELIKKQTELNIKQATSAVKEAEAAVAQAKAITNKVKTDFDHATTLQKTNAVSDIELENARDSFLAQQAAVSMVERRLEQMRDALKLAEARRSEIEMQTHDLAAMESTVRQANAAVGVAEAQLKSAEAGVRLIENQLHDMKVYAPCDGVVITRVVEPGEIAMAGSPVMVIVDFNRLYLKGYLPSNLISQIKLNNPAKMHIDAYPDKSFQAKVSKISQEAEFTPKNVDTPQQRVKLVFGVEIEVENSSRTFKPGMPADAVIKTDPKSEWRPPSDLR